MQGALIKKETNLIHANNGNRIVAENNGRGEPVAPIDDLEVFSGRRFDDGHFDRREWYFAFRHDFKHLC